MDDLSPKTNIEIFPIASLVGNLYPKFSQTVSLVVDLSLVGARMLKLSSSPAWAEKCPKNLTCRLYQWQDGLINPFVVDIRDT